MVGAHRQLELEVRMAFREVSVVVVREILRLWLAGHSYHSIARLAMVDRKSARRYVEAAIAAGLKRDGGEEQLTEELLAAVVASSRPDVRRETEARAGGSCSPTRRSSPSAWKRA